MHENDILFKNCLEKTDYYITVSYIFIVNTGISHRKNSNHYLKGSATNV